jgi:hypothetical protein
MPVWLTVVVRVAAALLGTVIARAVAVPTATGGIDWWELLVQLVVAVIGVAIVASAYARRRVRR